MSNLLKQCYVVNSGQGMRIINSNDRIYERLHEVGIGASVVPEENPNILMDMQGNETNGNGAEAQSVMEEMPKVDVEAIRKEVLAKAQAEADYLLADARKEAERLLQEADEKAQTVFEEQKKLGYAEGVREKEILLEEQKRGIQEELEEKKKGLSDAYEKKLAAMESDIVDAVIQVFDKVFQIQFEDKREILLALVENTLLDIDTGNKIRIRANDIDLTMLKTHAELLQKQVGQDVSIEFMHDKNCSEGQCQIETPYGVFDCGVDTQLSALLKDLRSLV